MIRPTNFESKAALQVRPDDRLESAVCAGEPSSQYGYHHFPRRERDQHSAEIYRLDRASDRKMQTPECGRFDLGDWP